MRIPLPRSQFHSQRNAASVHAHAATAIYADDTETHQLAELAPEGGNPACGDGTIRPERSG